MQRFFPSIFHTFLSYQYVMGLLFGYFGAVILNAHLHNPPPNQSHRYDDFHIKQNRKEVSTDPTPTTTTNIVTTSVITPSVTPLKQERILCWVVTNPKNKLKAEAVNNTWGQRCDKLLFMSSQNDSSLPVVGLPIGEESRSQLWNKAKLTFRYIYNNHLNDYDWFFKADDDTYAIIENMRTFLASYNSSQPLFLGHDFNGGDRRFLSGGAGYIMTRESLRLLVEMGLDQNLCPTNYKGEEDDVTITQCLERVGATVPDTRDSSKQHRFLSCDIETYFFSKGNVENCKNGGKGLNCLSVEPITFHRVPSNRMMTYDFLIYQMKMNTIP